MGTRQLWIAYAPPYKNNLWLNIRARQTAIRQTKPVSPHIILIMAKNQERIILILIFYH